MECPLDALDGVPLVGKHEVVENVFHFAGPFHRLYSMLMTAESP
jgi:hypothetical protein